MTLRLSRGHVSAALAALIVGFASPRLGSEALNLTTVFPATTGIYRNLITTGVGPRDTTLSRDAGNVILAPNTTNAAGRVGIGTTSPAAKLDIEGTAAGQVKIVDTTQGLGKWLTSDASGVATWQLPNAIPAGMVAFFDVGCPVGWSAYPAASGRYVVGNPAGGSLAAQVGTALGPQENRPVGWHTHGVSDPGHAHVYYDQYRLKENWCVGAFSSGCDGGHWIQASWRTTQVSGSNISIAAAGSVGGTNAPYIQLTACVKN